MMRRTPKNEPEKVEDETLKSEKDQNETTNSESAKKPRGKKAAEDPPAISQAKKRAKKDTEANHDDSNKVEGDEKPTTKEVTSKKKTKKSAEDQEDKDEPGKADGDDSGTPKKKTTKGTERVVLERGETPRNPQEVPGSRFLAMSWNITTIRSLVNKNPTVLTKLMETHQPDVICLQEHKLQEQHVAEMETELGKLLPQYSATWTCSQDKKGYSGIVVLTKKGAAAPGEKKQSTVDSFFKKAAPKSEQKAQPLSSAQIQPVNITKGLGVAAHDREGRLITVEYSHFFIVFTYVPNSGDGLKRLDYRIEEWDTCLKAHLKELEKKKPVLLGGDLNVAYLDIDIWNAEAKHIPKSAGTTPQERASFGSLLECGFKDTFRHFHADAAHCYTYWSVRAGNRPFNRGLRLDYFVASESLCVDSNDKEAVHVHDAWMLPDDTNPYGDHCPVAVVLSVPPSA